MISSDDDGYAYFSKDFSKIFVNDENPPKKKKKKDKNSVDPG